jgi:hypothetical protein
MAYHQYFPVEFLQLQEELAKHPDAVAYMNTCESMYLEDRLAHLCTYLDIAVDDQFDIDELSELAGMITRKLYEKRTGLVVTH